MQIQVAALVNVGDKIVLSEGMKDEYTWKNSIESHCNKMSILVENAHTSPILKT